MSDITGPNAGHRRSRRRFLVASHLRIAAAALVALAPVVRAAVIEFYNPDLDNYFITADPVEQTFVDSGAVGRWQRTGNAFAAGGPILVCRFGGNGAINPATGTFFGPNSHFYTSDAAECAGLKAQFDANAKSWKFESNDFRTTPAAGGACPAGLTPVYRAYNNGFVRGVDSNHRITSNFAAYQQTIATGSIGEGIVMCAPTPVTTAAGVNAGAAVIASIGPDGGTLATTDGRIAIVVPPGALPASTTIGIEPLSNPAPGKIGAAYRLTPEGQAFAVPVTIVFTYADADLAGTTPAALGAAFQAADGSWLWVGTPAIDATAKSVSIQTPHFSTWSLVRRLRIVPSTASIQAAASLLFQVRACYDPTSPDLRGYDCDTTLVTVHPVAAWSIDGNAGGTLSGDAAQATYTAPGGAGSATIRAHIDEAPTPLDLVAHVSFGTSQSAIPTQWKGTSSVSLAGIVASAEVTWNLVDATNNVATYHASGTAHLVQPPCTLAPSSGAIDPNQGTGLTIDYNANPPTYHGSGATSWPAVFTCPTGTFSLPAAAGFFGGGGGAHGGEAAGTVSADGLTIAGSDVVATVNGPAQSTWSFTAVH